MKCDHDRYLDPDTSTNDLYHRCNAVGGATCACKDARIALQGIDAVDDRDHVIALGWRGEYDIPGPGPDVFFQIFSFREHTRTLQHDIYAQAGPGQLARVFFAEVAAGFAIDH